MLGERCEMNNYLALRMRYGLSILLLAVGFIFPQFVATQTSDQRFASDDPAKAPFSVPVFLIEERINRDESADGIRLSISTSGKIMRVDIKEIPGRTSIAAVIRVIMMIGRLAESDYTEMRFSDEGTDIFVIDGKKIREIGNQFVWGEEGKGQNPIHLMRLFVDALRTPDGMRVAPPMTGSLLGDTNIAITTINKRFHPEWTMRTIDVR